MLTLMAGCINAVGFLSMQHQPLSHMSGTISTLGMEMAGHRSLFATHALLIVLCFFFGALVSGAIVRQSTLKAGRRYGVALMVESLLLVAATLGFQQQAAWAVYLATMACGLQNAMASSYSGTVIRTTHMTGMVTDLGIACGHLLRGQPVEWRRFRLYGVLLTGFLAGSYLGGLAFHQFGYRTLLGPAVIAGGIGAVYTLYKHWERLNERPSAVEQDAAEAENSPGR